MPPIVHLIKLDSWGGVERVFEGFWRHQAPPRRTFNLDDDVHPLFQPLFGADECLAYKRAGRWRVPKYPAAARNALFRRRMADVPEALVLLWNVFGFAVPRHTGTRLRFVHYDHGAVWKDDRSARARRYLRDIDGILTCAEANAQMFRRFWGWSGPLEVCLNGLLPQYTLAEAPRTLPRDRRIRIGTLSQLTPGKGVALLLHAVAHLRREGADVELHVAGDGSSRPGLERLARTLDLPCTFHGLLADVQPFFRQVDLVAFASLNESFPLVCVEALANACPVIATLVGGVAEVVTPDVTGVCVAPKLPLADYRAYGDDPAPLASWLAYFPAEDAIGPLKLPDPAAIARALRSVIEDPNRYAVMSTAALAEARARFSFEAYLQRVHAALERLS